MNERPIFKREDIVVPVCPKCSGRMDPDVMVPTRPEPGIRGLDLACHYGNLCRECGHVENYK